MIVIFIKVVAGVLAIAIHDHITKKSKWGDDGE
jgi:hypothetical protein